MGNCQAAEAATVVIQHPGNKVERIYWSISAHDVMSSNPGHYVALVISSPTDRTENGAPVKQLKLLRPADTLLIGQVYRLVSFEDVLKEFAAKKCVKLGKLLKESARLGLDPKRNSDAPAPNPKPRVAKAEHEAYHLGSSGNSSSSTSTGITSVGRHHGGGQWRPALQSIAEIGS
ncbi:PREDICTED: uncharacterized protein LOC109188794 [Ipomoea nil]|uniref:uncharacterized protein LOC109188794 n=1 Tax=Ipomoea nil TaxID=35883 RepID=UPI000900FCF5|nr:PREDICTED: uncharacterized protein LOC109188794 [Ipomoea nil]